MPKSCTIVKDGIPCGRPTLAREMCSRHYDLARRHGTLPARPTAEERFWEKVDKDGPAPDYAPQLGPCWIWTAGRNPRGYGRFSLGGRRGGPVLAYLFAYG